jgi:hypothetical protein
MTNKYRNKKTVVNNITFASQKEARRYSQLMLLQQVGKINDLELQKKFVLVDPFVNKRTNKKVKPITYICDFFYYDKDKECYVVEDVKGMKTATYIIKKKMFLQKFGDMYDFSEI